MNTIAIPRRIGFAEIEQVITELDRLTEGCNLVLPRRFEYRGFGIQISLIQIVFKWMRTGSSGALVVPIDQNDPKGLKEFAESFLGYIILLTVWKNVDIINESGESIKLNFRPYTSEMNRKIEFFDEELPNNEIFIPCFDHYSKSKGLSHWLYPDYEKFADAPSVLDNTIYRAFQRLGKIYKGRLNSAISPVEDDIEKILWELLKNTDEHARHDYLNQVTLSPNSRGMSMEIIRSNRKKFTEYANHEGLKHYYENAADKQDSFFLEISVYDSGPGLVKRFLGKHWANDIDINEEVNVVKQCLKKGATSVDTWKGKNKGFGLNAVLELLTKLNGFLKIRTNRCSLYRDLIRYPHAEVENASDIVLFDWSTNSETEFTSMNNVEGAVLTMAFPLPQNNHE
ncbi:hypothetical protein [Chitinophaga sp. Cy-1792]|uniref:hypothetical protein n=1 Tax=Chitinophaga sp. Cy-1792 TaxID=2608339 RepID=UPI00141F50C7|nr:hypothetical protein [Chitinophaga sp. Cy-1792]NIG53924.1 hypothetical protein [Chitinophaga sp. Cy-1792]